MNDETREAVRQWLARAQMPRGRRCSEFRLKKFGTHIPAVLFFLLFGCSRPEQRPPDASSVDHPRVANEHVSVNPAATTPDVRMTIATPEKKDAADLRHVSGLKRLVPHVELDAGAWAERHFEIIMHAKEWNGRSFHEIVPPSSIVRIIRLRDSGFASGNDVFTKRRYDALMDHLIESNEKAMDYGWLDLERPVLSLVLLTKDGEPYLLEVLETLGGRISAINVSGQGKGVRIEVKGFEPNRSPPRLRSASTPQPRPNQQNVVVVDEAIFRGYGRVGL